MDILLRLIAAHLIGDFFLQPKAWVESKQQKRIKSIPLVLHAVLHGVLAYIFVADWRNVLLALILIVVHWAIDLLKVYRKPVFQWFVIDQILHLLSILLLWYIFYANGFEVKYDILNFFHDPKNIWIIVGYIFVLNPTSMIIYHATEKWQKELQKKHHESQEGLENAGKWIGYLERILTLTFILFNQFTAIGFLIAAKSIFRFGDLTNSKERKLTEYILIGTFLSFTISILVGILIKLQL